MLDGGIGADGACGAEDHRKSSGGVLRRRRENRPDGIQPDLGRFLEPCIRHGPQRCQPHRFRITRLRDQVRQQLLSGRSLRQNPQLRLQASRIGGAFPGKLFPEPAGEISAPFRVFPENPMRGTAQGFVRRVQERHHLHRSEIGAVHLVEGDEGRPARGR